MRKTVITIGIALWALMAVLILVVMFTGLSGTQNRLTRFPDFGAVIGSSVAIGGNVKLICEERFLLNNIENINIEARSQSIVVTLHDGDELSVRYYDYDNADGLTVNKDGKGLFIGTSRRSVVSVMVFNFNNWPRLEISVPRSYASNIALKTNSGSIRLNDDVVWRDVAIDTSSGSIRTQAITAENLIALRSTSGSVRVGGDISCGNLNAESSSGGVNITESITASGDVALKTTSGRIRAANITAETISCLSSSGGISVGNLQAAESVILRASSGSVRVGTVNSPSHSIVTSSGSIRTGLLSGTGEVRSSSGSVRIGQGS
jgi:DUF4097 and DUF4098 domain-containing protein YvlB